MLEKEFIGITPAGAGKTLRPRLPTVPKGITPAGAGKTYMRQQNTTITKDHPRRCGENIASTSSATSSQGSPPQVRGKLRPYQQECIRSRITPAGAGKTVNQCSSNHKP